MAGFKSLKRTWGIPGNIRAAFSPDKQAVILAVKYMKAVNKFKERRNAFIKNLKILQSGDKG